MKKIIVFHKNCMDGIGAAFITKAALLKTTKNEDIQEWNIQYGEEENLFSIMPIDKTSLPKSLDFYFVDFSLNRESMTKLSNYSCVNKIVVIDHHKTAEQELKGLENELDNIEINFDMNKSGATLAFDYFNSDLDRELFEYIEDRDLWKWDLKFSKEISEALRCFVKPNDIDCFFKVYQKFNAEFKNFVETGEILLTQKNIHVQSKIKKVQDIELHDIKFKYLNATENISEIGNEIIKLYDTPALVYFINDKNEYVCSLRSSDNHEDVSVVANAFGGGGHRNACGFTLSARQFALIFHDAVPTLREIEFAIREWYIKKEYNKDCEDNINWFLVEFKSLYKSKVFRVEDFTNNFLLMRFVNINNDELLKEVYKYYSR